MAIFLSGSEQATIEYAKAYASTLSAGDVVLLQGEMGAGKTVFAKGVALGLGVTEEVLSPTYAYMNDYSGKLYHYDCYRLHSGAQARALGLTDLPYRVGGKHRGRIARKVQKGHDKAHIEREQGDNL